MRSLTIFFVIHLFFSPTGAYQTDGKSIEEFLEPFQDLQVIARVPQQHLSHEKTIGAQLQRIYDFFTHNRSPIEVLFKLDRALPTTRTSRHLRS